MYIFLKTVSLYLLKTCCNFVLSFYHQVQPLVVQVSMKASQSVPLYAALGVRKNVVQYPLITVYVHTRTRIGKWSSKTKSLTNILLNFMGSQSNKNSVFFTKLSQSLL